MKDLKLDAIIKTNQREKINCSIKQLALQDIDCLRVTAELCQNSECGYLSDEEIGRDISASRLSSELTNNPTRSVADSITTHGGQQKVTSNYV